MPDANPGKSYNGWYAPEAIPLRAFGDGGSGLERFSADFNRYIRMRDQIVIPTGIGWRTLFPAKMYLTHDLQI